MNTPSSETASDIQHSRTSAANWLWFIGTALIVFAARCREIHLHGGETPFLDQWKVEAEQILVPWLKGQLSWTAFFTPHHEHIPAWTRLLAWLEATLLGRWDPQLQCTINAVIWGVLIGLWSRWFRRLIPIVPAFLLTSLAVILAALPYSWENTTWGFQSHIPLALLFITWHIHGSFTAKPPTMKWWAAQAAGFAAFFNLGSMWAAPLAVLIVLLWTHNFSWRRWIPAAALTAIGIALLLYARAAQPHEGALAQSVTSLPQFLAALLVQLGWPSQWPAAAALLFSPSILLAWQIRKRPRAEPIDQIILAVALFAAAQATAFALARGGAWIGFVSRYGDILAVGILANATALWRLIYGLSTRRVWLILLALAWVSALASGLQWISTRSHTEYFHARSAIWAMIRGDAVRSYIATKSTDQLYHPEVIKHLYPDPKVVTKVLDTPNLDRLLPVQLRSNPVRERGDFASAVASRVRELWFELLLTGIILVLFCLILYRQKSPHLAPRLSPGEKTSAMPWLLTGTACAIISLLLWPMPLEFDTTKRWRKLLTPEDRIDSLTFLFTTPSNYTANRLTGAAALWPEDFRNTFYGTHIDGPGFTGSVQSSSFTITSPWLVIPIAGFPASAGNGISLRIEDNKGRILEEFPYGETNPASISFWQVDVHKYPGQLARLVYLDGRTDSEGWVAAAPPQPATEKNKAAKLNEAWAAEETTSAHRSIGYLIPILGFASLLSVFRYWRKRSQS